MEVRWQPCAAKSELVTEVFGFWKKLWCSLASEKMMWVQVSPELGFCSNRHQAFLLVGFLTLQ